MRAFLTHIKAWTPVSLWMGMIFAASADPRSQQHSAQLTRHWLFDWFTPEQVAFFHFLLRKGAHLTEYAILALLFAYALRTSFPAQQSEPAPAQPGGQRKWILGAWGLATFYAATDEFHQLFVPGRDGSVHDVLLDSCGAALGLWATWGLWTLYARWKARSADSIKQEPTK